MRICPLIYVAVLACGPYDVAAAQGKTVVSTVAPQRTCPFIVSPTRPSDSRGETVYEIQGKDQLNIPAAPGACVLPVTVSTPKIKFPKDLKDAKYSASVYVDAVITAQGDVIDARANDGADSRASSTAIEAAMQFKFKPATLDGKAVAFFVRMPINFRLKKFWGGTYPTDGPPSAPALP